MKHITPFFQSCQQSESNPKGSWSTQKVSNVHSMLQVYILIKLTNELINKTNIISGCKDACFTGQCGPSDWPSPESGRLLRSPPRALHFIDDGRCSSRHLGRSDLHRGRVHPRMPAESRSLRTGYGFITGQPATIRFGRLTHVHGE